MKSFIKRITDRIRRKPLLVKPVVSVSVASSDVGKCTKCRFNDKEWYRCTVGSYYAEKGINTFCYNGELWEATER